MKEIPLGHKTHKKVALVDDEDYEYLSQFSWYLQDKKGTFYAKSVKYENGKYITTLMHRLIMRLNAGDGKCVDHKNGDGIDNQKDNIRICTYSENSKNRKGYGTSKYLGVCWHVIKTVRVSKKTGLQKKSIRGAWKAAIKTTEGYKHLGRFNKEIDAALAYNKAAIIHHGEFANLNII